MITFKDSLIVFLAISFLHLRDPWMLLEGTVMKGECGKEKDSKNF